MSAVTPPPADSALGANHTEPYPVPQDAADQTPPIPALFTGVVGQSDAVAQLRAAARRPVHAYLLVGDPGLGQEALVRGFAAGLLCPRGGCGACSVCRRVLAGVHPDLVTVERQGAAVTVDDARHVVRLAQRRPFEAHRQVLLVTDVHLARVAAPVLLKTLEEPAGQTVFVLTSESVPAELATVASRCVRIDLQPLPPAQLASWLADQGVAADSATELAESAGGSIERARLLAEDTGFARRHALWRSIPERLDGTGATAASLAAELLVAGEDAGAPLRGHHAAELEALALHADATGERNAGERRELEERHRREERRWRIDELQDGLAVLARAYRDRLLAHTPDATRADAGRAAEHVTELTHAVDVIEELSRELVRNPNEALQLQALLVRLSAVTS